MALTAGLSPIYVCTQEFDGQGRVLAGGKIYTYLSGTTTPAATYTSSLMDRKSGNPIILDASGRYYQEIWLDCSVTYKFVLTDVSGNVVATTDPVNGIDCVGTPAVNLSGLAPVYNGNQQFDSQGVKLAFGKIYTYIGGTTQPLPTYTDDSLSTPNANPFVLDADGNLTGPMWLDCNYSYKFILKDRNEDVLHTADYIFGISCFISIAQYSWDAGWTKNQFVPMESKADTTGCYMAGGFSTKPVVVKVNPDSTTAWAKTMSVHTGFHRVFFDSSGNVVLCGGIALGGQDMFIIKLDKNGTFIWGKSYDLSATNVNAWGTWDWAIDSSDNIYACGTAEINETGMGDGGFASPNHGWIAKVNSTGTPQWLIERYVNLHPITHPTWNDVSSLQYNTMAIDGTTIMAAGIVHAYASSGGSFSTDYRGLMRTFINTDESTVEDYFTGVSATPPAALPDLAVDWGRADSIPGGGMVHYFGYESGFHALYAQHHLMKFSGRTLSWAKVSSATQIYWDSTVSVKRMGARSDGSLFIHFQQSTQKGTRFLKLNMSDQSVYYERTIGGGSYTTVNARGISPLPAADSGYYILRYDILFSPFSQISANLIEVPKSHESSPPDYTTNVYGNNHSMTTVTASNFTTASSLTRGTSWTDSATASFLAFTVANTYSSGDVTDWSYPDWVAKYDIPL